MLQAADELLLTFHSRAPVPKFDLVKLSEASLMIKRAQMMQKECDGLEICQESNMSSTITQV